MNKTMKIVGVLLAVMLVFAMSTAVFAGDKFITWEPTPSDSSNAPSDKAEIKKHAVVYIVGAVVLFAASGLLGIIRTFAGNIK